MGRPFDEITEELALSRETFEPRIGLANMQRPAIPEVLKFMENLLHAMLKRSLASPPRLAEVLQRMIRPEVLSRHLEVLGERALEQGIVDVLVKEATGIGQTRQVVLKVKTGNASVADVSQVRTYVDGLAQDCWGGILIAKGASKRVLAVAQGTSIRVCAFSFEGVTPQHETFGQLTDKVRLDRLQ